MAHWTDHTRRFTFVNFKIKAFWVSEILKIKEKKNGVRKSICDGRSFCGKLCTFEEKQNDFNAKCFLKCAFLSDHILDEMMKLFSSLPPHGRLREKFPDTFKDTCLYSQVAEILSLFHFRSHVRRFIEYLFDDGEFFKVSGVGWLSLEDEILKIIVEFLEMMVCAG